MPPFVKQRYHRPSSREALVSARPRFKDFHKLRCQEDYEYPIHQHADYEIILVEKGPYACSLNKRELRVGEGQALIIKPGDWHQDHLRRGQRHYVLHFEMGRPPRSEAVSCPLFQPDVHVEDQICREPIASPGWIFGELEREATEPRDYAQSVQDALLEALFWRMARSLPARSLSAQFKRVSSRQRFINDVRQVFEGGLRENLTAGQIAERLGMSKRSLSHKCRQLLGDSPASAYARAKIERASQLLLHTDRPIKDIAYSLGFVNPYHFSRVFKRFVGRPPSALRRGEDEGSGWRA